MPNYTTNPHKHTGPGDGGEGVGTNDSPVPVHASDASTGPWAPGWELLAEVNNGVTGDLQTTAIDLGGSYRSVLIYFSHLANAHSSGQTITLTADDDSSSNYNSYYQDGTSDTGQTAFRLATGAPNSASTCGWVRIGRSERTETISPNHFVLQGPLPYPAATKFITSGYHNADKGSISSIEVIGSSGDVVIEAWVYGWNPPE